MPSRLLPFPLILALISAAASGCGDASPTDSSTGGTASTSQGGSSTTTSSTTGGSGGQGAQGGTAGSGGQIGGTAGSGGAGGGQSAVPVTLLTLNLHCFQLGGTTFASNADRFAAIAAFAAANDVDVMTVQEACKRPGEDALEILRKALFDATSQQWSSTWQFAHIAWQGTPDEADEGVGLLVRGALSDELGIDHAVQSALHRVAASARLPPSLGGARVMSIHFDVFDAAARAAQAREASAAALADAEPLLDAIVAGDFNDVEGSPAWSAFPAMGYLSADEGLDLTGIDHVMIHRAAPLRPTSVAIVLTGAAAVSDHPGVLVHFEPATGDAVTITRLLTATDPGAGHFLSVRGDKAPLTWDFGFPMRRRAADDHALILTEMQDTFAFKLLRDDTDWQLGADLQGTAGTDQTVSPTF